MQHAGTMKSGSITCNLWITNISFSLNSGAGTVIGQNSVYFTAPKPSMPSIQFQIAQPSIEAMNATVGMLQRWATNNEVVDFSIPELNINYKGTVSSAGYTWAYNNPLPALNVSFACITNMLYTGQSGFNLDPDLWKYFTQSIVTKNISQLLNAVKPLNAASAAMNEAQTAAQNANAVAQWLKQKVQFNGYYIEYQQNGTLNIRQGGFWNWNVKPTPSLLYALEHGTYKVRPYARSAGRIKIASAH